MVLKVFFSWQSETEQQGFNNKSFLIECLNSSLNAIANKGSLKGVTFEFIEGMGGEAGHPDVAGKMFENADNCDIFVGDLTVVNKLGSIAKFLSWCHISRSFQRKTQNSNVLIELSRVLGRSETFEEQIVLVMNTINGDPEKYPECIPFDLRGRRWPITFLLKDKNDKGSSWKKAKTALKKVLPEALRLAAVKAIEHKRDKYRPFIGWDEHSALKLFSNKYYWNDKLRHLESLILSEKKLRIIGLSGLGKTRLVLETFRETVDKQHYLYCDCQRNDKKSITDTLKDSILTRYPEAIVVLDNCDENDFRDYHELWSMHGSRCRMIAIFNNPEEKALTGTTLCKIERNFEDIILKILESKGLTQDQLIKIKEFSGGIPLMAQLLAEGLKPGEPIGQLSDSRLISKILGLKDDDRKRIILQSISLFDYIGWKEDLRPELEYIITNKAFTSLDSADNQVLLNEADKAILKFINRNIIECRGRKIGLRPLPLALYLILEWLESCTPERLKTAILSLNDAPFPEAMTGAFHNQVKHLGFNQSARDRLDAVLAGSSPFASAEVINTEVGSHLLRTFAEITPVTTTHLLYSTIGNLPTDTLRSFSQSRRNLVWLLEKLCFRPETFNEAAYLMMRLGIAENEDFANNASNQFQSLFRLFLPSTSVPLTTRYDFLKQQAQTDENIPIIIHAIGKALAIDDNIYFQGAEQLGGQTLDNYRPETYQEIKQYATDCLDLLMTFANRNQDYLQLCSTELASKSIRLLHHGLGDIIIPYLDHIARLHDYDWDSMWDDLTFFRDTLSNGMKPDVLRHYDELLNKLTKTDIVSRFRRVQKKFNTKPRDFNKETEIRKEKYRALADEFINQGYDRNILQRLMELEIYFSYPFGARLAEAAGHALKYVILTDGISILNNDDKAHSTIIEEFINNLPSDEFDEWFNDIKAISNPDVLFSVVGNRGLRSGKRYIEHLFSLIKLGVATANSFYQFFTRLKLTELTRDDIIDILSEVFKLDNGIQAVINIGSLLSTYDRGWMSHIIDYYENLFINHQIEANMLSEDGCMDLIRALLNMSTNQKFISAVCNLSISYMETEYKPFTSSYKIEDVFSQLMSNHFDTSWPIISEALLSEKDFNALYYTLKQVFYTPYNHTSLLDVPNHIDAYKQWCKQYPEKAPSRLVGLIYWGGDHDGFSELTKYLIDNYGDDELMLDELSAAMGSFVSSGSVLPYYQNRLDIVKNLTKHANPNVRNWAERQARSYEKALNRMGMFEAEQNIPL